MSKRREELIAALGFDADVPPRYDEVFDALAERLLEMEKNVREQNALIKRLLEKKSDG